jgi:hypothetical protein
VIIKPLTVARYRRFVTRAFTTDDAAQAVFGFFSREAQGTRNPSRVVGKGDLSRGVDLRKASFLRLSIDGGAVLDIDCAGTRPRATLIR